MADERNDLEALMAHAALENAEAQTARIRARTTVWSLLALTVLTTLPAALIYVYVALWGWLQR